MSNAYDKRGVRIREVPRVFASPVVYVSLLDPCDASDAAPRRDVEAGSVCRRRAAEFLSSTHVFSLEFLESSVTTDQLYLSWLLREHGRRISSCHIFQVINAPEE